MASIRGDVVFRPLYSARMRAPVLALVLGGCSFSATSTGSGNSPSDAASDSDPPIIDGGSLDGKVPPICAGAYVNVCVDPPQGPVTLTTQKIDTTNSMLCTAYTSMPDTPDACVIAGQSIAIPTGNTVSVVGNRRLILLATGATGSITITGVLDTAGHGKTSGPAGSVGPCGTGAQKPTTGTQGGGGWGGSFGLAGNNGGNGVSGIGGVAAPAITATALRGGCPGSDGADNVFGGGKGDRGGGGGAVLLIATQVIQIDGTVNASGGGGGGASSGGGGGGGGSGGMIVLDAPTVNTPGKCFANAGGGGEGANFRTGRSGGESKAPDQVGIGGAGAASTGGDGGNGGFGATGSLPGSPGTHADSQHGGDGGGGGGGGGVGIIMVYAEDQSGTDDLKKVAPAPTAHN